MHISLVQTVILVEVALLIEIEALQLVKVSADRTHASEGAIAYGTTPHSAIR